MDQTKLIPDHSTIECEIEYEYNFSKSYSHKKAVLVFNLVLVVKSEDRL